MSSPSHVAESPITGRQQLIDDIASGNKPAEAWCIGTEHEKFGFRLDDLRPPTFDGERGIEALLTGLTRFGWAPVQEHGRTIALLKDGASVTLEPAGQLELSGAPLETIHDTCCETNTHLEEVQAVGIDPVHFGVVVTLNLAIGQQTPPVASVLMLTCSIAKESVWDVTRANIPFIGVLLATLLLITYIPVTTLGLVELFYR